jgi:hypothetical protein
MVLKFNVAETGSLILGSNNSNKYEATLTCLRSETGQVAHNAAQVVRGSCGYLYRWKQCGFMNKSSNQTCVNTCA